VVACWYPMMWSAGGAPYPVCVAGPPGGSDVGACDRGAGRADQASPRSSGQEPGLDQGRELGSGRRIWRDTHGEHACGSKSGAGRRIWRVLHGAGFQGGRVRTVAPHGRSHNRFRTHLRRRPEVWRPSSTRQHQAHTPRRGRRGVCGNCVWSDTRRRGTAAGAHPLLRCVVFPRELPADAGAPTRRCPGAGLLGGTEVSQPRPLACLMGTGGLR
jgi:hypothetical protein